MKEKEIQYEQIRKKAQDIIQGYKRISCLPKQAERGRTEAGSRNVEASCLIGIYDRTNTKDTKQLKELQESKLEEWAKYENIWFDHTDIRKNWKRIDDWTSKEAEVYGFKETKTVRKVFHYDAIDSNYTPMDFINNRISIHNALFSTTKYKLLGFTKSYKGFANERFAFVLEQPFIEGEKMTEKEIEEFMRSIGFPNNSGIYHWNDYYIVDDLHSGNILKMKNEDGIYEMFVIDPNPSLNTSKIKGGKSKYLPFRIVETIV